MSYRLIDANALNGVISNDDYEKVLNAPCIFADLPNGLDGEHYNMQEPVIDKIRAEIEQQEKWLMIAGYNAYNADIAFNAIKSEVDKYKADRSEEDAD